MKAISCQKPGTFKELEMNVPIVAEGEALVRINRIGICGTDIHAFNGKQHYFTYPRILGHELSGEVVELHEDSDSLNVGDHVTVIPYMQCGECVACRNDKTNCCTSLKVLGVHIDGGMKEYLNVPVSHLINVNSINLNEAALIEPLSIGAHAVRRSNVGEGKTALVIGAGPIGLAVMRFAKLTGAKVIAMDINQERLDFCKKWAEIDETILAGPNAINDISELTNGDFPAVVFDATGNQGSMNSAFQFVSHGGQLVFVGLIKGDITFNDPEFHKREMSLLSSRNATPEDFKYVISCIEKGLVNCNELISMRLNMSDLPTNFSSVTDPKNKVIKAIVELG